MVNALSWKIYADYPGMIFSAFYQTFYLYDFDYV